MGTFLTGRYSQGGNPGFLNMVNGQIIGSVLGIGRDPQHLQANAWPSASAASRMPG